MATFALLKLSLDNDKNPNTHFRKKYHILEEEKIKSEIFGHPLVSPLVYCPVSFPMANAIRHRYMPTEVIIR